eukprot:TRINITY_DN24621_c0_g1_i1.p1 TRINITY_DN24621_c0_g1~~TRINITY_DN24621_c0_g1_i1.p1  ORF type:complete len:529 (-),score=121.39 TRINITY_DN24621_c0_g1_i1:130-1716(-)
MSGDLDVQHGKLLDWLLARRVIPEDYSRLLLGVEAKLHDAQLVHISDDKVRSIIDSSRDDLTYYAVKDIYEALARTTAGQAKTLLGAHSDPATAKWRAVVDAYNRKNLKWTSGARILIQNVSYEIPALKKQIAACERQVGDCTQRQADLVRAEAAAKKRYDALLQELGILGFDPVKELRAYAVQALPAVHQELAEVVQASGEEVASYYEAFLGYLGAPNGGGVGVLPILRAVARGGRDVTVEDTERDVPALQTARREAPAKRIEFDDDDTSAQQPCEDAAVVDGGGGDIDWGLMGGISSVGENDTAAGSGAGGSITWDFEVADSGGAEVVDAPIADGIDWGAISLDCVESTTVAVDAADAAQLGDRLLDDPQGREFLYRDVAEAEAFLQARSAELAANSTVAGADESLPDAAKKTLAEVQALLAAVSKAGELLTGKSTQRLLLLRSSKRYVEQQVKRIDVAKAQCSKPVALRAKLETTKIEQSEEAKRTRTEMERIKAVTQRVQRELESELSAYFKCEVRIVGEISQI